MTFLDLFLASASIAGIAVIWRNWIEDHPNWKRFINEKTPIYSKAILCGSCLTYWLALLLTLVAHPLSSWTPFWNSGIGLAGNIFFQWMALAWCSVFLRFLYVAIQELVHYQMHHIKNNHNH